MSRFPKINRGILYALLAACFYALSAPIAKLLLADVSPAMMAAFLYLGAGTGMALMKWLAAAQSVHSLELPLTKRELPYILAMVVLDIAAPIFLMIGLSTTSAAHVSLLNNFEIVATALIAWLFFKEAINRKVWIGIGWVSVASMMISWENASSWRVSAGSLFVLLASLCWGLENNCTRMMADKNPQDIVIIKGIGSGIGSLGVAFVVGEVMPGFHYIGLTLLLGFVAYGLSVYFYVYAQRTLGAAKTSVYYAVAPFIGVLLSLLVFLEIPSLIFWLACGMMFIGTYYASRGQS